MTREPLSLGRALREHWPKYLMEAWGLGTLMLAVAVFATLLEYPGSQLHQALPAPALRNALMGMAMGLVVIAVVYSPWGKRSGAQINPAVTATFLFLGRVRAADAFFYILAQFAGGTAGIVLGAVLLGSAFSQPPVFLANTLPGEAGQAAAFAAEAGMSFGLMALVLAGLASRRATPFVGLAVGVLLALFIAFFAPLSGVSMNPARSFASAAPASHWAHLWIFFIAPPAGMLASARLFRVFRPSDGEDCAKLNHHPAYRCIHCGHVPPKHSNENEGRNGHGDRKL